MQDQDNIPPISPYPEWDVSLPTIPLRSRCYHLEPIGIGSPWVESLTGYVARLAETHHVKPKTLIMYEILPLQGKAGVTAGHYYRLNRFWAYNALTAYPNNPAARKAIRPQAKCKNAR